MPWNRAGLLHGADQVGEDGVLGAEADEAPAGVTGLWGAGGGEGGGERVCGAGGGGTEVEAEVGGADVVGLFDDELAVLVVAADGCGEGEGEQKAEEGEDGSLDGGAVGGVAVGVAKEASQPEEQDDGREED